MGAALLDGPRTEAVDGRVELSDGYNANTALYMSVKAETRI